MRQSPAEFHPEYSSGQKKGEKMLIQDNQVKPGYKTTEFYLTLAANVAGLLGTLSNILPAKWGAITMALSTGLYALSRGLVKGS